MPWRLRMVPQPVSARDWLALRPGDTWFEDGIDDEGYGATPAPEHAGKRVVIVRLPGPVSFPIYSAPTGGGAAWVVEGEPPAVTLVPSINCHGVYHGYITGGEISDDLDGRTYTADGALIRTGKRR